MRLPVAIDLQPAPGRALEERVELGIEVLAPLADLAGAKRWAGAREEPLGQSRRFFEPEPVVECGECPCLGGVVAAAAAADEIFEANPERRLSRDGAGGRTSASPRIASSIRERSSGRSL